MVPELEESEVAGGMGNVIDRSGLSPRELLRVAFYGVLRRLPTRTGLRVHGALRLGYVADIRDCKRINEYIIEQICRGEEHPLSICVHKLRMKQIAAQVLGRQWVLPVLWEGRSLDDPELLALDRPHVVKPVLGSGAVARFRGDEPPHARQHRLLQLRARSERYLRETAETWYKTADQNGNPIWYAELAAGSSEDDVIDLKVHCFRGIPVLVQGDFDRFRQHVRAFWGVDGSPIRLRWFYPEPIDERLRPVVFNDVVRAAEKLALGTQYVRADFICADSKCWFAELTLAHGSGMEYLQPAWWDQVLGACCE